MHLQLSAHGPQSPLRSLGALQQGPAGVNGSPSTCPFPHPYPQDKLRTPYLGEFDEARYVFDLKGKVKRHQH